MKHTLAISIIIIVSLFGCATSQKVTHKCTGCESISCNNLCWTISGAGFDKTQICPTTNCTLDQQFDLYGQSCSVNIKLATCHSNCCTGYSPLNIKSSCAETQFNNTAIGQLYCANQLPNGIIAAISVSGVIAVIIASLIVVCLVRLFCPEKEARTDIATVQTYSEVYTIKSYKPRGDKVKKVQSSLSHKKNRKMRRISDEIRDQIKMSEFQNKIGSKVLAVNSAPVGNQKRPQQSVIQNTKSGMQSSNSNGPIILTGNSNNISLKSSDSAAPLKIEIKMTGKPAMSKFKNVDDDQC